MILASIIALSAVLTLLFVWNNNRRARRTQFIRRYMFPPGLIDKLGQLQPQLDLKDRQLVARALRQFFLAHLNSGCKSVAMPSQVVDQLWHEFILYTRHYQAFCAQAFGRYMHHTPASALGANHDSNAGLQRVWHHCCLEENINPRHPTRLPLLFALDAKLGIAGGFQYALDCSKLRSANDTGPAVYCGGDLAHTGSFGSDSAGSESSVSGGSDAGSSCSGGCSGGCGGGGD